MDGQDTLQPSLAPVGRPKRRFLRVALVFLAVLFGGGATYRVIQTHMWKTWLVRTCEGADRVVLDLDAFPRRAGVPSDSPSSWPLLPSVTIDDAESVRQLVELIEFRPNWLGWHCRCLPDMKLRFGKGGRELLSIGVHHGEHFRRQVFSGPDMDLTTRSQAALAKWLDEKGGQALVEARQEAQRRMTAHREAQAREYSASTRPTGSAPSSGAAE